MGTAAANPENGLIDGTFHVIQVGRLDESRLKDFGQKTRVTLERKVEICGLHAVPVWMGAG